MNSSFGAGFQYVPEEEKEFLKEGDYQAMIIKVADNERLQGAIDVYFSFGKAHPNATPYTMTIFPRPALGQTKKNGEAVTQDDIKKWDVSISRFFDAFGIAKGDFNFNNWLRKMGWLTCKKNKNNDYCKLFVSFDQRREKKETVPQTVQNVASAVQGTVKTEVFPDDIPF